MADTPDLSELARRWFEMWEEQWRAMAADPETAESLRRMMALMGGAGAPANPFAAWTVANPFMGGGGFGSATPGAAPTAGPSGIGADAVDELGRRLAALEKRVAALESAGTGPSGNAKPAAGSAKPAKAAKAAKPAARSRKPAGGARGGSA